MEHVKKENDAYNKMLRYSVALAIIRSKPSTIDAKSYTKVLYEKVSRSETSWRSKAKKLEEELEKTKNEVALLLLKYASVNSEECADTVSMEISQINQHIQPGDSKQYSANEKFFFSVVNIQHWASILRNNQNVFTVIKQNLIKTLNNFEQSICEVNSSKVSMVIPTIPLITDILKEDRIFKDTDVLDTCVRVIESVVRCVLTEKQIKETDVEKLMEVVDRVTVCCAPVRDVVLEKFAYLISGYTTVLKDLPSILSLDPVKYDRIYYVCTSMLTIATTTLQKWPTDHIVTYQDLIEKDLFSISGKFPLYAHSVWSVLSYMTDCRS